MAAFHGSDLEKIEQIYGIKKEEITGFGANVNPLGLSPFMKIILPLIWMCCVLILTGTIRRSGGAMADYAPARMWKILWWETAPQSLSLPQYRPYILMPQSYPGLLIQV